MPEKPIIVWLRQDLRLADNPALVSAVATGAPVLLLFVLDDSSPGRWVPGGASRWWLHRSLESLAASVAAAGGSLVLRRGRADVVVAELAGETGASAVHCSEAYEPWARRVEGEIEQRLKTHGAAFRRFPGTLLHDPETLRTRSGEAFKVYTPFWRRLAAEVKVARPLPAPARLKSASVSPRSDELGAWKLLPARPDWSAGLAAAWKPGEEGATTQLRWFLKSPVQSYAIDRNRPDLPGTSRLSPHLHWGEVSVRQCWHAAQASAGREPGTDEGRETFLKELTWREFSYHLLHHFPDLPERPFRGEFAAFPWEDSDADLRAWQRGATGYPIVDAGMRELWATGWMHNRVRMIVASFLTKHLLVSWQEGEAWFWDTLVDADLANNSASWQWVAGSGADAAPYFRIFNPVKQGETFDPQGAYVRRWVPELACLPSTSIHAPWRASRVELAGAGVRLGETYPKPIVEHDAARRRALAAYEEVRRGALAAGYTSTR